MCVSTNVYAGLRYVQESECWHLQPTPIIPSIRLTLLRALFTLPIGEGNLMIVARKMRNAELCVCGKAILLGAMLGKKQKTDLGDQFGIDHVSPACAEDLDEMPPASANDAEDAMETRLSATLAQVIRLLGGGRCRYQSPCSADPAARR